MNEKIRGSALLQLSFGGDGIRQVLNKCYKKKSIFEESVSKSKNVGWTRAEGTGDKVVKEKKCSLKRH